MKATDNSLDSDTGHLARDLRALADDAQALLKHAVRDAGTEYEQARKRLEKGVAGVRARLDAFDEAALAEVKVAARKADAYVHENPWPAIGAGAVVGMLLGLLMTRR